MNPHRTKPALAYLSIAALAIVAWLPISAMIFSVKNDVLSFEYPIQFFISENLRKGNFPLWMDSWALGFPLQSVLTWGVYSTPRFLIGLIFGSSLYALHIEFILYSIASGCIMYKLLKTHFTGNKELAWILACSYMLSGFAVGSGQWLFYLTGMTFIPLVLYCFLSLLKKPSFKYSILFAASWLLLLTNVHIYLTVVSFYSFLGLLLVMAIRHFTKKDEHPPAGLYRYLALAFLFSFILCIIPTYYTFELVTMLERRTPIVDPVFFQSNYLHPAGLKSMLYPLSVVNAPYSNTEGTVLDTYTGLFTLLLLPVCLHQAIRTKNRKAIWLFVAALVFLIISFGHLTPIREWLNLLPGMGNFRHPGILRIYFILCLVLFIASALRTISLQSITAPGSFYKRWIQILLVSFLLLSVLIALLNFKSISNAWQGSIQESLKNISGTSLIAISAVIQFVLLLLFWLVFTRKNSLLKLVVAVDLVINTLICIPFFAVSSYSPAEVSQVLKKVDGFPVQTVSPSSVESTVNDGRNSFFNVNVLRKQVSTRLSMPGPLVLESISRFLDSDSSASLENKQLVFIQDANTGDTLLIEKQMPGKINLLCKLQSSKTIILQQANYPGWKPYYNRKLIPLQNHPTFVAATVPAGEGSLQFKYTRPGVFISAMILHFIMLLVGVSFILQARTRN